MNDASTPTQKALAAFSVTLPGKVIRAGDDSYDGARRVWNGLIDLRPALIVRCADASDVAAGVGLARRHNLPLAVRGGGHNVAGHGTCDAGLVIDLAPMKRVEVDPVGRRARVGAGCTWAEVDVATQSHGLVTPGGVFSGTGVAGLTLGGGFGWVRNKFGLSCDNLVSAQVVTASGQIVTASAVENANLLWGLRGGGGNFGIVTEFELALHPLGPQVMFAAPFYPGEQDEAVLRLFRDFCSCAPDEVSAITFQGAIPPGHPSFSPELYGRRYICLAGVYAGSLADGERVLQPLRSLTKPLADFSGPLPYVEVQRFFDADYPTGGRYYWKSLNLARLDDEVIHVICEQASRQPAPHSTTDLWHIGGAIKRIGASDSAYFGRQANFLLSAEATWHNPHQDAENIAWARNLIGAVRPYSDGGAYLNFGGFLEDGETLIRASFGPQYARLQTLKREWDPDNFFRLNQNILPATGL